MLWRYLGTLLGFGWVLISGPVLAEGVEVPRDIRPTPAGGYVLRAVLSTDKAVNGLRYSLHRVVDGKVDQELPDVQRRPEWINTRAGEKRPVLLFFQRPVSKPETLALCIFGDPPKASSGSGSRLQVVFRYCKLLQLQPSANPTSPSSQSISLQTPERAPLIN
jgi:hypothetical protein